MQQGTEFGDQETVKLGGRGYFAPLHRMRLAEVGELGYLGKKKFRL